MTLAPALAASLWSASKLKTWHACPRRFQYRYVHGLGEPPTDAQRFGTAIHSALEAWLLHHHEGADARLAAALAAINLANQWDDARARAVILGYECRWGDVQWRVLAVEVSFEYELAGHVLRGQIDAIVQDERDGRVYVVEHKTSSADTSYGSSYWERLAIDTQVSIYVDGASVLGYDIAGVVYDVLGKPKHEPRTATPEDHRSFTKGRGCKRCGGKRGEAGTGRLMVAEDDTEPCNACAGSGWLEAPRLHADQREDDETVVDYESRVVSAIAESPDAYYRRGVIVRTEDELPRMRSDLLDTIKLARAAELFDVFPRNTSACTSHGSTCWFLSACTGAADLTDPRFQRKEPQSEAPALTNP